MTPLETPYFCRSQSGEFTGLYETPEKAIAEAEQRKIAPFTVFQYLEHPIMLRMTNGRERDIVVGQAPEPKHADDAA